jgi:hypothetical protein
MAEPTPRTLIGLFAGQRQDQRQIMRGDVPEGIVLGVELAQAYPVGMDVAHGAELSGPDHRLERLESGMEAQHVAGHGHQAGPGSRIHDAPRIGDGQGDRLLHQHVLAGLQHGNGLVGMILRRQGQHHAVDFRIGENLLDGHGPDRMDAGKLACPVCMAVADGMKRAELGEGAGMVGAPVTTSDDGDPGGGALCMAGRFLFSFSGFLAEGIRPDGETRQDKARQGKTGQGRARRGRAGERPSRGGAARCPGPPVEPRQANGKSASNPLRQALPAARSARGQEKPERCLTPEQAAPYMPPVRPDNNRRLAAG